MPTVTNEQVINLFKQQVPEQEMHTWAAQYGKSAPFFWAAQAGYLQVPQQAQGFYNLPPQDQDDWYGEYGSGAAEAWAEQSGAGPTGAGAGAPQQPAAPASPVAQNVLGGLRYPNSFVGQTVRKGDPGKGAGIEFGQTVAPSTWNKADPSQGRSEGWGSIGAGTAGIQFGKGVLGFGKGQIDIRPEYLKEKGGVFDADPHVAPGYIPGSGTYNQYDLSKEGLFSAVKGSGSDRVVNSRFGLGGTGDPTTGGEVQTPNRYVTGNMGDSGTAEKGDAAWQKKYGGGGAYGEGGGVPGVAEGYEAEGGGGFFGAGPGYSPSERGALWGQDDKTRGLDYLVTLFMRSDTPTGIGTPAWSAPQEMWQGLLNAIRDGIVVVTDPNAWQMIKDKTGATPQSIGGKAVTSINLQPDGKPGTGAGGTGTGGTGAGGDQADPRWGVGGTWQEGEATPWGPIKGGLPGGFGFEWQQLQQEMIEAEFQRKMKEAEVSGQLNGLPTLQKQQLMEQIRHQTEQDVLARMAEDRNLQQQVLDEAFRRAELKQTNEQFLAEMGFKTGEATGFLDGKATLAMQQFLANQQQAAYERAANPALAFQNELARGATGWNNGNTAGMAGIPGLTMPGQDLMQFAQAGGFTQTQQPMTGAQQAQGYGYGTYPGAGVAPGPSFAQQAQAQGAQANAAAAAQQTAQPYQNVAAQQTANQGAAAPASVNPFAAQYAETQAPGTAQGQTGQQAGELGGLSNVMVRTPAAVNAFKAGTGISSSGNYGAAPSTVEGAQQAVITPAQVRMQNLKQTRKLSPVARAVVGSFGAAGGTDEDTFKFYADKKAPKATTAAGSYNMR